MPKPLIVALEQLLDLHQQLLKFGLEKKTYVIEGKVDLLNQLLKKESAIVRQLGMIEEERSSYVQQFLRSRGLAESETTLSQVLAILPASGDRDRLQELATALADVVKQVQELNKTNTKLLEDALAYVNRSLDLLTDPVDDDWSYRPTQQRTGATPLRNFFDSKA